jgi:hypothetical protein
MYIKTIHPNLTTSAVVPMRGKKRCLGGLGFEPRTLAKRLEINADEA